MIKWLRNIIDSWQWDLWHIACTLFIIAFLLGLRYAWKSSFGKDNPKWKEKYK